MIVASPARADWPLLQQWRRQIGHPLHREAVRDPRELAALAYIVQGSTADGLADLWRLTTCVLHDVRDPPDRLAIRFAGYRARMFPGGISIGGAEQIRFEKDLALRPDHRDRGRQFRWHRNELLRLALQMERRLARHARFPFCPRSDRPHFPRFWVALSMDDPIGQGSEFDLFCRQTGWNPERPLVEWRRDHLGQALYPLEFVSHLWRRFRNIYVEVQTLRKCQVIRLRRLDGLVGHHGVCQFDLLHSRFQQAEMCG
jgi:hypothetical protein